MSYNGVSLGIFMCMHCCMPNAQQSDSRSYVPFFLIMGAKFKTWWHVRSLGVTWKLRKKTIISDSDQISPILYPFIGYLLYAKTFCIILFLVQKKAMNSYVQAAILDTPCCHFYRMSRHVSIRFYDGLCCFFIVSNLQHYRRNTGALLFLKKCEG